MPFIIYKKTLSLHYFKQKYYFKIFNHTGILCISLARWISFHALAGQDLYSLMLVIGHTGFNLNSQVSASSDSEWLLTTWLVTRLIVQFAIPRCMFVVCVISRSILRRSKTYFITYWHNLAFISCCFALKWLVVCVAILLCVCR